MRNICNKGWMRKWLQRENQLPKKKRNPGDFYSWFTWEMILLLLLLLQTWLAMNHCLPLFFFHLKGYFNWKALHIWHLLPKWSRKSACALGVLWASLSDRKFPEILSGVPWSCRNQTPGLCWSRVTFQSLISPWVFWYLFCSYGRH